MAMGPRLPSLQQGRARRRNRRDSTIRVRLSAGVAWLCGWRGSAATRLADSGAHAALQRRRRPADGCGHLPRRRALPVRATQARLPDALPYAVGVLPDAMDQWSERCVPHGSSPRALLRWLLLGADGDRLRRRGDEPVVDDSAGHRRARGTDRAAWATGAARTWLHAAAGWYLPGCGSPVARKAF